jgi:hypothetical protein
VFERGFLGQRFRTGIDYPVANGRVFGPIRNQAPFSLVIRGEAMPKARPVSLHPLSFDRAIKSLIAIDPDKVGLTSKRRKRKAAKRKIKSKRKLN